MARHKVNLPTNFIFTTSIAIRITDINYGGHVGNDSILSLVHEARLQYLRELGYTELAFGAVGLIMADASLEFRNELFYGDTVIISIACGEISKVSFDLYYKLEKLPLERDEKKKLLVAVVKTGMVCYDYAAKKVVTIPEEAVEKIRSGQKGSISH